jgi:flagellar hook-basal body complex protein FliE
MDGITGIIGQGAVAVSARADHRRTAVSGEEAVNSADSAPKASFEAHLLNALNDVNKAQNNSGELTRKLITDPDSVNVHNVTIAGAEATLALSMAKAIVDKSVTAYRDIINIR